MIMCQTLSSTGRESLQITKGVMRGWGKAYRQEEQAEEEEAAAEGTGEDFVSPECLQ